MQGVPPRSDTVSSPPSSLPITHLLLTDETVEAPLPTFSSTTEDLILVITALGASRSLPPRQNCSTMHKSLITSLSFSFSPRLVNWQDSWQVHNLLWPPFPSVYCIGLLWCSTTCNKTLQTGPLPSSCHGAFFLAHSIILGWPKFVRLVNTLFNQILGENAKCVFQFYLKLNELFGQPNTTWLLVNKELGLCHSEQQRTMGETPRLPPWCPPHKRNQWAAKALSWPLKNKGSNWWLHSSGIIMCGLWCHLSHPLSLLWTEPAPCYTLL